MLKINIHILIMLTIKCCAPPPRPHTVLKRVRRQYETNRIESVKSIQDMLKKTVEDEIKFLKLFFPEKKKEVLKVEVMDDDEEDF